MLKYKIDIKVTIQPNFLLSQKQTKRVLKAFKF